MSALQAIKYTRGKLEVLDQLRLPHESVYDDVSTCEQAFDCIKSMRVRGNCVEFSFERSKLIVLGAPAIAIVAALALAVELENADLSKSPQLRLYSLLTCCRSVIRHWAAEICSRQAGLPYGE